MLQHDINHLSNFIAGWYIDSQLCDRLIAYHGSAKTFPGLVGGGIVKPEIKKSTDCHLERASIEYRDYVPALTECFREYIKLYPYSAAFSTWGIAEEILLKRYLPGEGFYAWHTERTSARAGNVARTLVFMTYLNDVTDAGETEFFHQHLKVKPEKGLTLIWPADWTFTHRGITSPTQEKFIATGWASILN